MCRIKYTNNGVRILSSVSHNPDEPVVLVEKMILKQYIGTTDVKTSDIDLFTRMTFEYLQIECVDGPPEPLEEPTLRERYVMHDNGRNAIAFCLEFDQLADMNTTTEVIKRVETLKNSDTEFSVLVILHHQRHIEKQKRELLAPVPQEVQERLKSYNATVVTVLELQALVLGMIEYDWSMESIKELLFTAGRQAEKPPGSILIGIFKKLYPNHSVLSIDLLEGQSICNGDRIVLRVSDRFHGRASYLNADQP